MMSHSHVTSKEQHKQTKQKQICTYREQTGGCQIGGVLGGWMKKVKVLRSKIW